MEQCGLADGLAGGHAAGSVRGDVFAQGAAGADLLVVFVDVAVGDGVWLLVLLSLGGRYQGSGRMLWK